MLYRDRLATINFLALYLVFTLLIAIIETTYGIEPALIVESGIFYKDNKKGHGQTIAQIINETKSEGVELVGNVTYVVDGDTLDINDIRVRLSLVDTPERGQPGYKEAKDFVNSLCLGKKGELDVDDGQRRGDRYGREIGIVYCNGVNINEKLMGDHLAKILTEYCDISEFSNEKWAKSDCS